MRYGLPALLAGCVMQAADAAPKSWIDPDTGHRVVRLSDERAAPAWTSTRTATRRLASTRCTRRRTAFHCSRSRPAKRGRSRGSVRLIDLGRKYARVYYTKGTAVFLTDYATQETRKIAELPERGGISKVNADETLLAGTYTEVELPANARPAGAPARLHRGTRSISP